MVTCNIPDQQIEERLSKQHRATEKFPQHRENAEYHHTTHSLNVKSAFPSPNATIGALTATSTLAVSRCIPHQLRIPTPTAHLIRIRFQTTPRPDISQ